MPVAGICLDGDPKGATLLVNGAFCELTAERPRALVGRPLAQRFHPVDRERFAGELASLAAPGAVTKFEARLRRSDGAYRWVRWRFRRDEDGLLYGLASDVTEGRRERSIVEQTHRLAEVGGWELDLRTGDLYWTEQTYRIHGLSPNSFEPAVEKAIGFYAPEWQPVIWSLLEAGIKDGRPWEEELEIIDARRRRLWVRATGQVEFADGRPLRLFGAIQNIHERKLAEIETRRNERLLQRYFDMGLVGMSMMAPDRSWIKFNDKLCSILGYTGEELARMSLADLTHPDDWEASKRALRELETGEKDGLELEKRYLRKDGTVAHARVALRSLRGEDGSLEAMMALVHDVTEMRRDQLALRAALDTESALRREAQSAREEALKASRAKSEFLAVMSHELRTPLNPILGFGGLLLEEGRLDEESRSFVASIKSSAEHLLEVIGDILDYSKIEAGKLTLERERFELSAELATVFEAHAEAAREKGVAATLELDPALPERVVGDAAKLRQMLHNLMSNAVKFTPAGSIVLRGRLLGRRHGKEASRAACVRFEVEDTGIGVPVDKQQALFEPFTQADSAYTRQYEGTGLGLSITRRLAEAMGGQAGLRSQPGEGSVFWVELLLEEARAIEEAAEAEESPQPPLAGGRCATLLVEDNEANRKVAAALLESLGCEVTPAASGREALELAGDGVFDIALMDLQMPGWDGFETLRQLRELYGHERLTAIAMTAHVTGDARQRVEEAGFDGFLAKPVSQEALRRAIEPFRSAV